MIQIASIAIGPEKVGRDRNPRTEGQRPHVVEVVCGYRASSPNLVCFSNWMSLGPPAPGIDLAEQIFPILIVLKGANLAQESLSGNHVS
jgi:hypothetical protein